MDELFESGSYRRGAIAAIGFMARGGGMNFNHINAVRNIWPDVKNLALLRFFIWRLMARGYNPETIPTALKTLAG